jgi:predicted dithiol-disulfide oxidoreductase (DUF899 family)
MERHPVVAKSDWLKARRELLLKEKEFTRLRDQLAEARRALPWKKVEKTYVFDAPSGKQTLADLFTGRSQLVVYHFMFDPSWEAGCKSCSFWADNYSGAIVHLQQRDVTMVTVSRAPLDKIDAFKKRMGWTFKWVSSLGSDFNTDFGVTFTEADRLKGKIDYNYAERDYFSPEAPGLSVFAKNADGAIFHTYSCYARGLDMLNSTYQLLDLVPKGRDEASEPYTQAWVRHHDRYES